MKLNTRIEIPVEYGPTIYYVCTTIPEKTLADQLSLLLYPTIIFPQPAFTDASAFSILALGFALGLRHALDADHLVAVSTIVSRQKSFLGSSVVGVLWGIGHTASLLLAGLVMITFRVQVPEAVSHILELGVALMLIGLGGHVLWKLARGGVLHVHVHSHGSHQHLHPHIHTASTEDHTHHAVSTSAFRKLALSSFTSGKRSVFVGMVHGFAGSGALMLAVLTTISSPGLGLTYIAVFGFGSIGGMLVMSALIGIPFALAAGRSKRLHTAIAGISGVLSVALGFLLVWDIGIAGGLFIP